MHQLNFEGLRSVSYCLYTNHELECEHLYIKVAKLDLHE